MVPSSPYYKLETRPASGRSLFAKAHIPNGTLVLTTSGASQEPVSPSYHAILRLYKKEVCAECFQYDRGREWKIKINTADIPAKTEAEDSVQEPGAPHQVGADIGVVFCSDSCRSSFVRRYGLVGIRAFAAVEQKLKHLTKRGPHPYETESLNKDSEGEVAARDVQNLSTVDIAACWKETAGIGQRIVDSRAKQTLSKTARRMLVAVSEPREVSADILYAMLTGSFSAYLSGHFDPSTNALRGTPHGLPSIRNLAADPDCYQNPTSTLRAYTSAYLLLLTILPPQLLPYLTTTLAHDICSRAHHNAFSIRPAQDGDQSGEFLGWGVWPEASFFNHSCERNVAKDRVGRVWQFRVDKEGGVAEGEELCITYLGGEETNMSIEDRRSRLKAEWGFECRCHRCLREVAAGQKTAL